MPHCCREEEEEKHDVRKVGHMGNFYANLLTRNVAMGTAPTAPSSTSNPSSTRSPSPAPSAAEGAAGSKEHSPLPAKLSRSSQPPVLDKYEQARRDVELALRAKKVGQRLRGAHRTELGYTVL
jgi:coiled-coil domain-containing protein 55